LMFGWQRLDAVPHQYGLLTELGCLVAQRIVIGEGVAAVLKFLAVAARERGQRHGTLLSQRIAVPMKQNRAQPGEKAASSVVAAQTLPGLNQSVLNQIFSQGCVAAKRDGLSQQARFINPTDLAERLGIP